MVSIHEIFFSFFEKHNIYLQGPLPIYVNDYYEALPSSMMLGSPFITAPYAKKEAKIWHKECTLMHNAVKSSEMFSNSWLKASEI